VAAGGDGTVGLVAAALRLNGMRDTAMAIVPLGTGNILARTIGVRHPDQAIRALQGGTVRHIDVMRTSHPTAPVALVSVSGGFEGRFLERYARWRRFGRPLSALAALAAASGRSVGVSLMLDGEAVVRGEDSVFSVGLYNTPFYAAGIVMSPEADIEDGRGEGVVYWTAAAYRTAILAGLRGGATGDVPGARRRSWRFAHMESEGALQVDGEPVSGHAISVWLEPSALGVFVPPRATSSLSDRPRALG